MKQIITLTILLSFAITNLAKAQWQKVYSGNYGISVYSFGDRIIVPTLKGGVAISLDNGKTWKQADTTQDMQFFSKIAILDSTLYASTFGGVYASMDTGRSWEFLSKWPYSKEFLNITTSGNNLLAGDPGDRVVISKDHGRTWDSSNTGLPPKIFGPGPKYGVRVFSCFISFYDKVIMSSNGPDLRLYTSYDHGESWNYFKSDSTVTFFANNLVSNKSILAGDFSLHRSDDSGKSWRTIYTPKTSSSLVRTPVTNGKVLMATVDKEGIIFSKDDGKNWKSLNEGIGNLSANFGVAINAEYAYCTTSKGEVYRRSLSEFTEIDPIFPEHHTLNVKVYPNPLKDFATIEFGRNLKNGMVKLYNIRGQELMKIENINDCKSPLMRANLAAGTYIYIVSEGSTQLASGKMELE